MRYVAAYLLAQIGGKESPSESDVKSILSSVGVDCDAAKMKKVISELSGKDVSELITKGQEQLATVPTGGVSVAAAPSNDSAPKEAEKPAAKKEKPPSSESDDDIGMSLFG